MAYNDRFERSPAENRTARELPETVVQEIIKDAEQTSVVLQVGNVRRLSTYKTRFRLQSSFPGAYWITGQGDVQGGAGTGTQVEKDRALKQTTQFQWRNKYITPEELAVMAVMPDNWKADSDLAWEEIRTALRTAFAQAIDRAVLFGDSKYGPLPSTFGVGVVAECLLAANLTIVGSGKDRADEYAIVAENLEASGYEVTNFLTRAAELWKIRRLRDTTNQPIYQEIAGGPTTGQLYGRTLNQVANGAWDETEAIALAGDWSQLHVGIRQDMEFAMSNSAPIFDTTGALVYNPFQQDGEVLRACMRIGYVVTDPLKHLGGDYPFWALVPSGYSS